MAKGTSGQSCVCSRPQVGRWCTSQQTQSTQHSTLVQFMVYVPPQQSWFFFFLKAKQCEMFYKRQVMPVRNSLSSHVWRHLPLSKRPRRQAEQKQFGPGLEWDGYTRTQINTCSEKINRDSVEKSWWAQVQLLAWTTSKSREGSAGQGQRGGTFLWACSEADQKWSWREQWGSGGWTGRTQRQNIRLTRQEEFRRGYC